jgi:hypothetical protein
MSQEVIQQGVPSFRIKANMPTGWYGQPTSVTADVVRSGVYLETDAAVTLYAGDTLAALAYRGQLVCTLTTGTALEDGEFIQLGSDAQGWQSRIVAGYTASSKALRVTERFDENLEATNTIVAGRTMYFDIDTTTDDYDFIGDVVVVWKPVGIADGVEFTEDWTVLKRSTASAGLEQRFAAEFKNFWPHVEEGQFKYFEDSAFIQIDQKLKAQNRDIKRLIGSSEYDLLKMTRIALNIANRHGTDFDSEALKLQSDYDDMLSSLLDNYQWEDSNQDLVPQESEINKGSGIANRRSF